MQRNTKFRLIIGLLTTLALAASIYARFTPRFPGDLYLTLLLQSIGNGLLLSVMQWISFIFTGWSSVLLVVIIGIVLWWRIGRLEAILVAVGGLLTLINGALKLVINRPRPSAALVHVFVQEQDSSFPSGHSFFAIVILGLLAYFVFVNLKNRVLRMVVLVGLIALILLVGTSRVYLGVHWPRSLCE